MRKVIEWCEQHKKDPPASADDDSDSRKKSTDIDEWDQKFMQVDQEMLFEIILVSLVIRSASPRACAGSGYSSTHVRMLLHTDLRLFHQHRLPTTSTSRRSSMSAARLLPT